MIIPVRVKGWLLELLTKEANRSEVIRMALTEYYERRMKRA